MKSQILALIGLAALVSAAAAEPPYAAREDVRAFIDQLADRHGFDRGDLLRVFRQVRRDPKVIKAIMPPADPGIRSWRTYRSRYIDEVRITAGLSFWTRHRQTLREAEARHGVPASVIVAIIGVETIYGRHQGRFPTLATLATLAFDYPPRAELFRRELEEYLLLARERGLDPLEVRGSFAGALGIPQFLPSSYREFAVDFDADGEVDLLASAEDAIGSVANFLARHGWKPGAPVAAPVAGIADAAPFLAAGIVPTFTRQDYAAAGMPVANLPEEEKSALIDLVTPAAPTEYWLGFHNFYVITRYNRSSFYAMAVHQLSEALAARR